MCTFLRIRSTIVRIWKGNYFVIIVYLENTLHFTIVIIKKKSLHFLVIHFAFKYATANQGCQLCVP